MAKGSPKLPVKSYEEQLLFISERIIALKSMDYKNPDVLIDLTKMYLSLAESVKDAREHNMECQVLDHRGSEEIKTDIPPLSNSK